MARVTMPDGTDAGERLDYNGMTIGDPSYAWLIGFAKALGSPRTVEFGPGRSTQALLEAGCTVVSYEASQRWLEEGQKLFKGLPVAVRPLSAIEADTSEYALAFVDGPTGTPRLSRLLTLGWAARRGIETIVLHDAARPGERESVETMLAFCNYTHEYLPIDTGISIMRRK